MKILRWPQLKEILKISRSTIDRWEKANQFPKRIDLGKNSIAWDLTEVNKWIEQKFKERTI